MALPGLGAKAAKIKKACERGPREGVTMAMNWKHALAPGISGVHLNGALDVGAAARRASRVQQQLSLHVGGKHGAGTLRADAEQFPIGGSPLVVGTASGKLLLPLVWSKGWTAVASAGASRVPLQAPAARPKSRPPPKPASFVGLAVEHRHKRGTPVQFPGLRRVAIQQRGDSSSLELRWRLARQIHASLTHTIPTAALGMADMWSAVSSGVRADAKIMHLAHVKAPQRTLLGGLEPIRIPATGEPSVATFGYHEQTAGVTTSRDGMKIALTSASYVSPGSIAGGVSTEVPWAHLPGGGAAAASPARQRRLPWREQLARGAWGAAMVDLWPRHFLGTAVRPLCRGDGRGEMDLVYNGSWVLWGSPAAAKGTGGAGGPAARSLPPPAQAPARLPRPVGSQMVATLSCFASALLPEGALSAVGFSVKIHMNDR